MTWKKIWWFIWKDDSFASLLVNILLAIVIIKYLLYPGLGLALGTSFPVVAVVSCSMQHDSTNCWADCYLRGEGSLNSCLKKEENICGKNANELNANGLENFDYWSVCGQWYEDIEIIEEEFSNFQQSDGFNIGDIFILKKAVDIKIGDVIVYNNKFSNAPIIHRVIGIEDGFYMTKGDHNADASFFEKKIVKEQVYGKVLLKIPYLGWVKVLFNIMLKGA